MQKNSGSEGPLRSWQQNNGWVKRSSVRLEGAIRFPTTKHFLTYTRDAKNENSTYYLPSPFSLIDSHVGHGIRQ